MPRRPIQVVIVDDEAEARAELEFLLVQLGSCVCVAEFTRSSPALEQIARLQPTVVFTDIIRPGMTGLEFTRQLKVLLPDTKVIIISGLLDAGAVRAAILAGASGYIAKPASSFRVKTALDNALAGSFYVSGQPLDMQPDLRYSIHSSLAYPRHLNMHTWRLWVGHREEAGYWPHLAEKARYRTSQLRMFCGRSDRQLRRDWLASFGLSPREWLQQVQINTVKLLLSRDMKIDEIHPLVGLRSPSTLRRTFRLITGTSLREYRSRVLLTLAT